MAAAAMSSARCKGEKPAHPISSLSQQSSSQNGRSRASLGLRPPAARPRPASPQDVGPLAARPRSVAARPSPSPGRPLPAAPPDGGSIAAARRPTPPRLAAGRRPPRRPTPLRRRPTPPVPRTPPPGRRVDSMGDYKVEIDVQSYLTIVDGKRVYTRGKTWDFMVVRTMIFCLCSVLADQFAIKVTSYGGQNTDLGCETEYKCLFHN